VVVAAVKRKIAKDPDFFAPKSFYWGAAVPAFILQLFPPSAINCHQPPSPSISSSDHHLHYANRPQITAT
jgi:hypothetical protein